MNATKIKRLAYIDGSKLYHPAYLAYDKKGNLWMTNSQCENMLKMMEPDGTWHKYNIRTHFPCLP